MGEKRGLLFEYEEEEDDDDEIEGYSESPVLFLSLVSTSCIIFPLISLNSCEAV